MCFCLSGGLTINGGLVTGPPGLGVEFLVLSGGGRGGGTSTPTKLEGEVGQVGQVLGHLGY